MSAAAMQAAGRHVQVPTSVYTTAARSSPGARQYPAADLDDDESYYLNHNADSISANPQSTQASRRTQNHASSRQPQHTTVDDAEQYYQNYSPAHYPTTTLPIHSREQAVAQDQYDGAPNVPPRTTSHQASPSVTATTRPTRYQVEDTQGYVVQNANSTGDYQTPARDRSRDDTSASATSSARNRRRGPASPEGPQRATSTKERGGQQGISTQNRSEATMNTPAPLLRENSEVLSRTVISDPVVDEERMRARIAEAQPMAPSAEAASMGLTSEYPGDGGRGPQKRQDYSKSKRREIQFGDYVLGQTLGEGEFGKVKLGWKKDGSSQVAIKLIRRESVASNPTRLPKIYREIAILRDLAHPNIVRLHEMVETERHIGIILEYASGGELFDYILNQRYLKDPSARRLFAQLVSGVGYLHKKGIVHRDLKLENLLLDQNKNIIITDFGFANTFNPHSELSPKIEYNLGNKEFVQNYKLDRLDANGMRKGDLMQTSCGSPCYAAPELVVSDSLYTGRKVDVWSCGVILYAMLAGYLPFDDDPANPEGDNINLLYKYITTTPLTFPEYVTPHARDLLRRILVPDPRKRADLFEVARHSWLSEYHHVVANITSSTTNLADIANSTVTSGADEEQSLPYRSQSVRMPSASSPQQQAPQQPEIASTMKDDPTAKRERGTRHTLQPEYVAPKSHTERIAGPEAITRTKVENPGVSNLPVSLSKPLPQDPPRSVQDNVAFNRQVPQPVAVGPSRPGRDVPRSASDVAGNLAASTVTPAANQFAPRPSTQGSLTSANGPTRSDLRLPSTGSYGQPVAPSVATTTAQGKVTQPAKQGRGYNISGPQYQHGAHNSIGQPMTNPMSPPTQPQQQQHQQHQQQSQQSQPQKTHHRRTSTLSSIGEKLFGRSNSISKKDREEQKQKANRKYPPTAMKNPYPEEPQPRMSTDSKRSFSFGLRRKESADGQQSQEEKPGKRFSLIPSSMSFKNFGGNKDQSESPRVYSPDLQVGLAQTTGPTQDYSNTDGQIERKFNFSRPPQAQNYGHRSHASTNDVYGSTGIYMPDGQQNRTQHHQRAESYQPMSQYVDTYGDQPRPSMNSGRNVLTKPNRRFNDAYEQDSGRGGSSGAVKKVQDFFRRRGRARADSEYR